MIEVEDRAALSPAHSLEVGETESSMTDAIQREFQKLKDTHRSILRKHFGIGHEAAMSQAEIAREIGVSAQRVQSIVSTSLDRLARSLRQNAVLRETL